MQKRSDQDLKAPEDPLSPWRAAKPRRSLRDIAGEPESPKALAGNNESPPNSSHKESTRLESGLRGAGGLDLSHSQVDDEMKLSGRKLTYVPMESMGAHRTKRLFEFLHDLHF